METRLKTIAFSTLGCKLNFSETDTMRSELEDKGFIVVGFREKADIYIINSCTVTGKAEKRCRALVRQAHSRHPEASIIVAGCYPQTGADAILSIPGVTLALGNTEKHRLYEYIQQIENQQLSTKVASDTRQPPTGFIPGWSRDGRTRSFFKIQDGCDYHCAYCAIPMARGRSRSNTIRATLDAARAIALAGIREVVLTGVNIGDFGKPYGESFFGLLTELVKVEGLERIRLSSIEPDLLTEEIIRLVAAEPSLMPHFHIPLQSGSDTVLKSMGRRYSTMLFSSRIQSIKKHIPHACIAADVIVGYPEETKSLFRDSLSFVQDTDLSYLHIFTYSERENTRAASMKSRLSKEEKKERSGEMLTLAAEKKNRFILQNKGLNTKVLWEKEQQKGYLYGFTENYIRAKTLYSPDLINEIQTVSLKQTDRQGVYII